MISRQAIYDALWSKLESLPQFVTKSRRVKHWVDVPSNMRPALYMAQTGESVQATSGEPSRYLLNVDLYVYGYSPDPIAPGSVLNPLIDAIDAALNEVHPIAGQCWLDHLSVSYCRIEGSIETDEGTLGDDCVAIIPVQILAA